MSRETAREGIQGKMQKKAKVRRTKGSEKKHGGKKDEVAVKRKMISASSSTKTFQEKFKMEDKKQALLVKHIS